MKTLYLHIGTPKTATTAIQEFCSENQAVLQRYGYDYPLFEYRYQSVSKYRNGHWLVGRLRDGNGKRLYEQDNVKAGLKELLAMFEKTDRIILSDEGIWNRGFFEDTHCWKTIKKELIPAGITVKVIVYFRPQDDFLFSWWNQQIKEGTQKSSVMDWNEIVSLLPYIKLDYYSYLSQIAEYVGKENIIVRLFRKDAFAGGRIEADFLEAVGLSFTEEYNISKPVRNPSLTKNSVEIKRLLNTLPGLTKEENICFRKLLLQMSGMTTENKTESMFSAEEREQFMKTYQEGNRQIAKEYMGKEDGELFGMEQKIESKWTPSGDQMIQDVVRFFGMTTIHLMEENAKLKAELDSQKEQLQVQKKHISNIRYKLQHPVKAVVKKITNSGDK